MQRLRNLLVIVPGIGGSVLSGRNGTTWNATRQRIGATVLHPGALGLDRFPDLEPTDLIRTFSAFGSMLTITGYEGVGSLISTNFRDVVSHTYRPGTPVPPGVDVLLFPYDFRRSMQDSATKLADAVRAALGGETPARRPVVVLAHSMGGLVARYWIGPLGGWTVCSALLTLGTPHRGAPKAVDWLVRGPGVSILRHPGVRRVLRGWPSMYELLPQYPAVWDEAAGHEVELTSLRASRYAGQFAAMAAAGRAVHDDIADAWAQIPPNVVPDVVPYFGRGHATPNLLTLRKNGRLVITKVDPSWRGNVGWHGDGTVPVLSAIPRELGESRASWRGRTERHGPLAGTPSFVDQLLSYSGEAVPTRGGEMPPGPWLGIDVEDVLPTGEEIQVGVTVQPTSFASDGILVTVNAVPSTGRPLSAVPMSSSGSGWHAVLPPLAPGRYRLEFEAKRVLGPESVFAAEDVVVLDPADEAEAVEEAEG